MVLTRGISLRLSFKSAKFLEDKVNKTSPNEINSLQKYKGLHQYNRFEIGSFPKKKSSKVGVNRC